jgi:hypothetical protein
LIGRAPRPDLLVDGVGSLTEQGKVLAEEAFSRDPSSVRRDVHSGEHVAGRIMQRYGHTPYTHLKLLVE